VGADLRPAHLLLLQNSLGDQRINCRFGKGGCNTQASAIAGSAIDDGTRANSQMRVRIRKFLLSRFVQGHSFRAQPRKDAKLCYFLMLILVHLRY
jgi:hypothetical protein